MSNIGKAHANGASVASQANRDAAFTLLRLRLLENGYVPIPVNGPDYEHPEVNSPGKQPFFRDWQQVSRDTLTPNVVEGWTTRIADHPNTGLLTGEMLGLDIDVPIPSTSAQLQRMAVALLADTPLLRIGKAPKALLCYRVDAPMKKMATPALFLQDGTKLQIEAMGKGQQIVGFGLHPDTGAHYAWPKSDPTCIPLADLPTVSETELRSFLAAAEAVLRAAGGLTKKEREAAEAGLQPSRTNGKLHTASTGNGFFREVNRRALADIGAWIQEVFPKARQEAGTKAWRVSSVDLGRSLQEDISVHPDGARDFGIEENRTPTHLVMEWTGAATARDAAFYLCDRLGITPAECGWQNAGIGSAEVQERKLLDTGPIAGQVVSEREVELAKLATLDRITYDEQREEAASRLSMTR